MAHGRPVLVSRTLRMGWAFPVPQRMALPALPHTVQRDTEAPAGDEKGTGLMASRFGGRQESDLLENLGAKYSSTEEDVQLVSLGSYCGPKLSFQKMGKGAATLPFESW